MCRHKIPPRGCLLASNMIDYLIRNKKFRVSSRYEVPRLSTSGRGGHIILEILGFRWFALILHGLFSECLAMLAAMPRHLRSTSDPEFFVLSQVKDHIWGQEASLCRNFMPTRRFQTGFFLTWNYFFDRFMNYASHIHKAGHDIVASFTKLVARIRRFAFYLRMWDRKKNIRD